MTLPETLQRKLEHWRHHGRIVTDTFELFQESNWLAVLVGQHVMPRGYDPIVDHRDLPRVREQLNQVKALIRAATDSLPTHRDFVLQNFRAYRRRHEAR